MALPNTLPLTRGPSRAEWMWAYPAQVIIAIDQVMWTGGVTTAIRKVEGTHVELDDEPTRASS